MNTPIGKRHLLLSLAAVLALGGCFKMKAGMPTDAPSYVHVYPDAAQVMQVEVAGMKALAFQTPATPDTVLAYYRAQAATDQLPETPVQGGPVPGQTSTSFGSSTSDRYLVVMVRPHEQGSAVTLTYKPPAKAP